ncbi:MAG: electron transporter RnfE [Paludibacteraceae bacterium]|nr:electron transporter RnfE [Paludibacteraceae bacterium]
MGIGLGFTLDLGLLGAIRELLGAGTLLGMTVFPEDYGMLVFILAPGAFIALGLIIAFINSRKSKV